MRITYPDAHNLSTSARPTRVARKLQSHQGQSAAHAAWQPASGRGVQVLEIRQASWPEIWGATPNLAASPRKAER